MGRERMRRHCESYIKKSNVAQIGYPSAFAEPNDKKLKPLRVVYDQEYEGYVIDCAPVFFSVMEAIEEVESKF